MIDCQSNLDRGFHGYHLPPFCVMFAMAWALHSDAQILPQGILAASLKTSAALTYLSCVDR